VPTRRLRCVGLAQGLISGLHDEYLLPLLDVSNVNPNPSRNDNSSLSPSDNSLSPSSISRDIVVHCDMESARRSMNLNFRVEQLSSKANAKERVSQSLSTPTWYETISLERLDLDPLNKKAQKVFDELIKNGLFLDDGITFARAHFGLSRRIDMNKIFAPAFQTTYRVRNHVYVNRQMFEELMLQPVRFVNRYKRKLAELAEPTKAPMQGPLFSDIDGN
jgi:hypothetical protein